MIEDVFTYELWKDNYLDTPQEFFDQIGLGALDFSEPQKLIAALRDMPADATAADIPKRFARNEKIKEMREEGMTQQAIADEVGLAKSTVNDICSGKQVATQKTEQPKRKWIGYAITQYTKPETAAQKIRDTFGDEFADQLKALL